MLETIAISYREGIEDAWANVAEFVPKLAGALAVFIIGWFVARAIRKVAHRVLTRVKFDKWVDSAGLGGPLDQAGYPDSGLLLAKIIYWSVMLLVLQLTIDTFGDSAIQDALDDMVSFLPNLFVALVIVVVAGAVAARVRELVLGTTGSLSYSSSLARAASVGIWIVGIFAALNQIEVAEAIITTLFSAIVGTIGLVIVIMFGVGGIQAARDRFWPALFDRIAGDKSEA